MDNIRISVVMPTYNSAKYIKTTLDTIFEQTMLPSEVVIVDDGSSDDTVALIEEYKENKLDSDCKIKLISQNNKGAGAARNKAVENATGNWIAFLDSDDIWDKEKISYVYDAIKNEHADIITHDEYVIYENDPGKKNLCELHKNLKEGELFLQLYEGNMFSTSCMVVKKELLLNAGLFDETLKSAQDYDLWIRCGMNGKVYFIEKPLETYVMRPGNITANTFRRYKCEMRICRKYIEELKQRYSYNIVKKIVRKRVFNIHKVEMYLALKQMKIFDSLKILFRLMPEIIKKV